MSSSTGWMVVLLPLALAFASSSCGSSSSSSGSGNTVPPDGDAGPVSGTPTVITITTVVPRSSATSGGPTNATWAAVRKDDGPWSPLVATPLAVGSYVFETKAARWAVAFACANSQNSLVAIHEDVTTVTRAEVTLESWCAPPPSDVFTLTGTLSNVSATTGWLDFGYPLESRGVTLPISGTNATYEEVNVIGGTWDLAFGLRDDSGSALTKVALLRNQLLNADETLNVDLAGAASFAPGSKKIAIQGIDPNENVAIPVHYATGADVQQGIDLGPQNVPPGAGVDLVYGTIPPNIQAPTDHYHAAPTANTSDEASRGVTASFHDPIDLDLTFPLSLEGVTASVVSQTPYIQVTTNIPTRANIASIDSVVLARVTNKSHRVWRMAITSAALGGANAAVLAMPDLTQVAGFDTAWVLPVDIDRRVTATVHEAEAPLGDGTIKRFASRTLTLTPDGH